MGSYNASMRRLSPGARSHVVAALGEFVGTWLFLFFAFAGTQFANFSALDNTTQPSATESTMYISLAFGFSLMVNVWAFYRVSGSHFNPAVTVAMLITGALPWTRAITYVTAQLLAGIAAAAVVSGLFPGSLAVATTLSASTSPVQGLFIEMFLTSQLVLTIFMLSGERHKAINVAPVGIGLALFICELTGVHFTGGSLNPARSFGPAVVLRSFPTYHWLYWLGPILGSVLATGFYQLVKLLQHEDETPKQGSEAAIMDLESANPNGQNKQISVVVTEQ